MLSEIAFNEFQPKTLIIGGGVAASTLLREELSQRIPLEIEYMPFSLCTDNAAMIATLGYYHSLSNEPDDAMTMEINPSLAM